MLAVALLVSLGPLAAGPPLVPVSPLISAVAPPAPEPGSASPGGHPQTHRQTPGARAAGLADLSRQPTARVTPVGFVQMFVAGVMPTDDGHTMMLVNPDLQVLLPVGVGLPEAVSIYGRLENKTAPRPMTHDLLDHVVTALGAVVVRVQIDDLKDGAFIGTVFLRGKDGKDIAPLDARASDAVAVALAAQAPIFVARPVVDRAALTKDDLERMPSRDRAPPGAMKVFDL